MPIDSSFFVKAEKGEKGDKGDKGDVAFGYIASYYSTETQTGTVNSVQPFTYNNIDFEYGIEKISNHEIKFLYSGKYNFQFSTQYHQNNGNGTVNIWLRKNNIAIENTNTKIDINANNPYVVAAWNFFIDVEANDIIELVWSSTSANTHAQYTQGSTINSHYHPNIPSIILTINQVGE